MSNVVHVVAWGRNRPVAGAVIEEPERVAVARRGGAVLLPVDRDLLGTAHGWQKREFGQHGFDPPFPTPGRFCPIAIRIEPARPFVHWAIEFVREERSPSVNTAGLFRLGSDTSQPGTIAPRSNAWFGDAHIEASYLEWETHGRDEHGRFAVRSGVLHASVSIEGMLGLAVYGAGTGVRVRRVAVSVCSVEEP